MSKTLRIRTAITSLLKSVHPRVYFEDAKDSAQFPYVIFEYWTNSSENKEIGMLEVNVWDSGTDTSQIEMLADRVQEALDRYKYHDDYVFMSIYKAQRSSVRDENKSIKRRRLTFEIQIFEGRKE